MDEVTNALADIASNQKNISGLVIAYTNRDGQVSVISTGDKALELIGLSELIKQRILAIMGAGNE